MRILYLDHYAGSLKYGMEFRPYYLAREWAKKGCITRVIAGDYSHLRKINPKISNDYAIEVLENGIEYQWIKTGTYSGNGIKRAFSMFRYVVKLFVSAGKISKEFKPDVVITSSTYPLDSFAGYKIAKKSKCKYVHEAHDIWPLTLVELGGMNRYNPFVVLLKIAERFAYKKCDKIVSILPKAYEHMQNNGLNDLSKFEYIPNGIALEDWENPSELHEKHRRVFEELKNNKKFVVCYVGGHALSNSLDVFLDAACGMKENKRVAFVLVGNGIEKERLIAKAEKEELTNVVFLDSVDKREVPNLLSCADVLYIGAKICSIYRYGVSMNKVYDYMMAAKPIIYGVEAANNDVEEAECGITIKPDNANEINSAILSLMQMDKDERVRMGENGKEWVEKNCAYNVLADKFINTIMC